MEKDKLMVDTNILIDYFRKTEKEKSLLIDHIIKFHPLYISSITEFEVLVGAAGEQLERWSYILQTFIILEFDSATAQKAAEITQGLKKKRKNIDKADLFIAATAIVYGLTLDTANRKHFEHIEDLSLFSKEKV